MNQASELKLIARRSIAALLLASGAYAQAVTQSVSTSSADEDSPKIRAQSVEAPQKLTKATELEEIRVLGSRIRRAEVEGPSAVVTFDRSYIDATGAMTMADFFNFLPQNYTGISSGRGSTPNEFNPEFGQRTETSFSLTSVLFGASAATPGQTGVSGISLSGLGAGSTLVLVDGRRMVKSGEGNLSSDSRQGFVDLNGIPFGMVERVEIITDGSSALYGADAVGGVVNIVLKKNWTGTEISGSYRGAFHGGGHERLANITTGIAKGNLQVVLSADYYSRADLKASQRAFSKNQDHRDIVAGTLVATGAPSPGRDLRINFGYPGVVQARTGNLGNFFLPDGTPARFALVKDGITGNPVLSNFTASPPSNLNSASGLTRGNTAEFLDLIPESERYNFGGNFSYRLKSQVELYGNVSYADTRGVFDAQPGAATASATSGFGNFATIVPAVINGTANPYNPFGQDVLVGMVHYEFGSTTQKTRSETLMSALGVRGLFGNTWQWDASYSWQNYKMDKVTRLFNGAALTAALANPDLSQRLNPFLDARVAGSKQADIYERMARYNTSNSDSTKHEVDVAADGDLFSLPGGPIKMAAGANYYKEENENITVNTSEAVVPVATRTQVGGSKDTLAAFSEVSVPIFGRPNAVALVRRLDLQFAGRYEDHEKYSKFVPKYGIAWVPVKSLLLRASYSEGFRVPFLTEYQIAPTVSNSTVVDPRRTPASTPNVQVSAGSVPDMGPETSTTEKYGLIFEPPVVKGLTLEVNYTRTEQKNALQRLSATVIINNEALFQDRVVRAPATPADIALNQPGQLLSIDSTFVNFGSIVAHSLDFRADYTLPNERFGRWRFSGSATRSLKNERSLAPGQPPVILEDDTGAPPKWRFIGSLLWNRGPLSGSLFVNYIDGFQTNLSGNSFVSNNTAITYLPTPSVAWVSVRGSYRFPDGVWRGYGKGLMLSAGINNVFDKEPSFSDTVFGYNGAIHSQLVLGRAYELSFRLPF